MYTTKVLITLCVILLLSSSMECQSFRPTELDRYISFYKIYRRSMMSILGRTSQNAFNLRLAKQKGMVQDEVPPYVPFPCNVKGFRSAKPPASVHKVRPGDIDVVGALGDSLTAGFGLVATNFLQVLMENRGLSWSAGGQGTWRQYLTLPNILKEFNPKLIGYSLGDSFTDEWSSQFNPSEGAAISSEIPYMAKILIKRIASDKRVNMKRHWKLITLMVGANDVCLDFCFHSNMTQVLENHRNDMIQVLRLLRDNLPRTIVNFVAPPNVENMAAVTNDPESCKALKRIECYCLFSDQFKQNVRTYYEILSYWQKVDEEVANMPEFHQNDDFTVIFQPMLETAEVPRSSTGQFDLSYLSSDCFHLSQKFNARAANSLWNNMLERKGNKSLGMPPLFETFRCPTRENPYIIIN